MEVPAGRLRPALLRELRQIVRDALRLAPLAQGTQNRSSLRCGRFFVEVCLRPYYNFSAVYSDSEGLTVDDLLPSVRD